MNVSDLNTENLDQIIKWNSTYCDRADCSEPSRRPVNKTFSRWNYFSSQMSMVLSKLDNLNGISTDINSIKHELVTLNEILSDLGF